MLLPSQRKGSVTRQVREETPIMPKKNVDPRGIYGTVWTDAQDKPVTSEPTPASAPAEEGDSQDQK